MKALANGVVRERNYRSETARVSLPCGGEITLTFVERPRPVTSDDIDVEVLPKVFCPGSYSDGKGCPWFERLWKYYSVAPGLDIVGGDGNGSVSEDEADVADGDRVTRGIGDYKERGIAICGRTIFYDRKLRAVVLDEEEDVFDKCPDVKSRHTGIIAFLARLFRGRNH